MMKGKKVILAVILFVIISVSGLLFYEYFQRPVLQHSDPIEITSDTQLRDYVSKHGFHGDGSVNDPFVFEYLIIDNVSDVSFKLHNTRSHVLIQYNQMSNAAFQNIWLWNAHNVQIRENQLFDGAGDAIYINNSKSITIDNNKIWDIDPISNGLYNGLLNFAVAIDVQYSTNIIVKNNYIHDTYDGIWFWGYNNNSVIENNRIVDLSTHGMGFGGPENEDITIRNNYIEDITYGMWLLGEVGKSLIEGNTVIDAFDGIRTFSAYLTIRDNYFGFVRNHGIYMQAVSNGFPDRSSNYVISGNTFENITRNGIYLEDSNASNNTITDNNFINNYLRDPEITAIVDNGVGNHIERNYFNDFTGLDSDQDGFFDLPYDLDGTATNSDPQPRVELIPYTKME